MFCFGDVCMYWLIGKGVKNSINIMVEATAVHTIEFTCLESCNSSSGDVFLDGDGCWGNCKLGLLTQKAINTSHFLNLHLQQKCQPYVHTFQISRQLNL